MKECNSFRRSNCCSCTIDLSVSGWLRCLCGKMHLSSLRQKGNLKPLFPPSAIVLWKPIHKMICHLPCPYCTKQDDKDFIKQAWKDTCRDKTATSLVAVKSASLEKLGIYLTQPAMSWVVPTQRSPFTRVLLLWFVDPSLSQSRSCCTATLKIKPF